MFDIDPDLDDLLKGIDNKTETVQVCLTDLDNRSTHTQIVDNTP